MAVKQKTGQLAFDYGQTGEALSGRGERRKAIRDFGISLRFTLELPITESWALVTSASAIKGETAFAWQDPEPQWSLTRG